MIRFVTGDIFETQTEAIVNTVNLVGVMGKGVALQFKQRFKDNYVLYRQACDNGSIAIGKSFVVEEQLNDKKIYIINFPTKKHWRNPSEYIFIEKGLANLKDIISRYNIKSMAIPALGAGNGGLDWNIVKEMISNELKDIDCEFIVYEPGFIPKSNKRDVKLTEARALLVYMLEKLHQEGMEITQFSAVKTVYFLQRFGAADIFKEKFMRYIYGPYCDSIRHMLYAMDGAYIRGMSDMTKKPFEPFDIVSENMQQIWSMVIGDKNLYNIAEHTYKFLENFCDDFSLELLSSVDFIMSNSNQELSSNEIYRELCEWNGRKRELFIDKRYTDIAIEHITKFL